MVSSSGSSGEVTSKKRKNVDDCLGTIEPKKLLNNNTLINNQETQGEDNHNGVDNEAIRDICDNVRAYGGSLDDLGLGDLGKDVLPQKGNGLLGGSSSNVVRPIEEIDGFPAELFVGYGQSMGLNTAPLPTPESVNPMGLYNQFDCTWVDPSVFVFDNAPVTQTNLFPSPNQFGPNALGGNDFDDYDWAKEFVGDIEPEDFVDAPINDVPTMEPLNYFCDMPKPNQSKYANVPTPTNWLVNHRDRVVELQAPRKFPTHQRRRVVSHVRKVSFVVHGGHPDDRGRNFVVAIDSTFRRVYKEMSNVLGYNQADFRLAYGEEMIHEDSVVGIMGIEDGDILVATAQWPGMNMDTRFYVFWIQECHSQPERLQLRKTVGTKVMSIVREWSRIVNMRPADMVLIHNNQVMNKLTTLEHSPVLNAHTIYTCHVRQAALMGLM